MSDNHNRHATLQCRDLEAYYGSLTVCRGVTLAINPGELVALVGPNGAGKSSFVGALNGTVSSRGEIDLGGDRLAGVPAHRRQRMGLATVPDNRGLFPPLSVAENLQLGAQFVARRERAAAIAEAIALFPFLETRMSTPAGSLSGGEQQMLAVAKNLAGKPRALLLDEPSQGLAPIIIEGLVNVFTELRDTGLPILLVEQNHGLAARVASRIAVMVGGSIILEGPPSELENRDRIADLFLRRRNAA